FVHLHTTRFLHITSAAVIYTLSLHDALPISRSSPIREPALAASRIVAGAFGAGFSSGATARSLRLIAAPPFGASWKNRRGGVRLDRKSTRLNSSHVKTSYAVFCLKKKKCNKL